jgi:putative glycosyltransferase (TIGR04372 family)
LNDAPDTWSNQAMQRSVGRIINLTVSQMVKTIRRPSRVFVLPYVCILRPTALLLGHSIVIIFIWCTRALDVWPRGMPKILANMEADYQFRRAYSVLNENNPEKAWPIFERCLQLSNDCHHFTVAAVCLHVGLGRMQDAVKLYQKSNQIRLSDRPIADIGECNKYCLLDDFWARHIGHAAQIDYVLKLRILDGSNPENTILYTPQFDKLPNRFLVEQWKQCLRLIKHANELPFNEKYVQRCALDFYVPSQTGIGKYYLWELAAQTYQRWAEKGCGPLLRLSKEVEDRGRRALAGLGLPHNAWFVGLHVREPNYHSHHRDLHDVLNAKIEDYLPAISEITRRGGWVIRMGDSSMTPLPLLPNVLDYCHSDIRSDWMDVFLAAKSSFFVGTPSGVCYVAQDYGVPCVLTNWWPPAQRPWHRDDIFVPKLLRRKQNGEILSLDETLNEPFGYCNSLTYLEDKHGVIVKDNDPEDIRAAVLEMLERIDGQTSYDQNDLAMAECAGKIYSSAAMRLYDSPGAFGAAALARDFLRRNPSFLQA